MTELKALLEAAEWITSISCNLGSKQTSIHWLGFCLDFLICGGSFLGSWLLLEANQPNSSNIWFKLHVGITLYIYCTVYK